MKRRQEKSKGEKERYKHLNAEFQRIARRVSGLTFRSLIHFEFIFVYGVIKLLEENIGKTLSDIHHSRILYEPPPRIFEIKAKINKWDLINLKSFCTSKETISKVKRQPSEWEKIIANEATDKQLISRIYKQLLQLNSRKINDPISKN